MLRLSKQSGVGKRMLIGDAKHCAEAFARRASTGSA
jgi:hypothetical protein